MDRIEAPSELNSSVNPSGCNATSETSDNKPHNTCTTSPSHEQPVDEDLPPFVCSVNGTRGMDITLLGCSGNADAQAAEGINVMMLIVPDGEPPACDIHNSNTSEDHCTAQDGCPLIHSTIEHASNSDETRRIHEADAYEMICEMQAPELYHPADTIQFTSHEMVVCDGTTRPETKISDEFNAIGTCQEHTIIHVNKFDAETSLPREEQTYTAEIHKETESYVTEQNQTSTDQTTTSGIDAATPCQDADWHGSSRTNDPYTTYHPEDTVVSGAGSADDAAVNNVRPNDAITFNITQENTCNLDESADVSNKHCDKPDDYGAIVPIIDEAPVYKDWRIVASRFFSLVMGFRNAKDDVRTQTLIKSTRGLSVSFAGDVAESFHAEGFMRRSVLHFSLEYLRVYKVNKTTKIFGPDIGEALVSNVQQMPDNVRRLFTPKSKDVLDKYSFIMIPFPDWHNRTKTGMSRHYVLVVINFIAEKFNFFDSGRNLTDRKLRDITVRVVRSIKSAWGSRVGEHPNVRCLNNFQFEFADMPRYMHAQDGVYLMLQMIETIEFDEYCAFTGKDAEKLHMLWMFRIFGEVDTNRVKFDILASGCTDPTLDFSTTEKIDEVRWCLKMAASHQEQMLADGREKVRLHFTDLEVLRIADMEENECPTKDAGLNIRYNALQESKLISQNTRSSSKSSTLTNADCIPIRSTKLLPSSASAHHVPSKMSSRCKGPVVVNNEKSMLQSGRPPAKPNLSNRASSSMIPTGILRSNSNPPQ
ncbi:hypothetical protein ACQ4PT_061136 [Festuca glaucescens]